LDAKEFDEIGGTCFSEAKARVIFADLMQGVKLPPLLGPVSPVAGEASAVRFPFMACAAKRFFAACLARLCSVDCFLDIIADSCRTG
jgi:hypothetical protein